MSSKLGEGGRPHVYCLPFQTLGHVNPMLYLAHQLLSSAKVMVTVVYSNRIYHSLQRELCKDAVVEDEPHFEVEVVPDGLPTEDSHSLSREEWWSGMDLVEKGMDDLIQRSLASHHHPVSCIVHDTFLVCGHRIANKYGLPKAEFWSASAAVYSMVFHIPLLSSHGFIPYKGQNDLITIIPGLLPMPASAFPKAFLPENPSERFFQSLLKASEASKEADWILLNTVYALESNVVESLRAENLPVCSIGPLIPRTIHAAGDAEGCINWLDTREPMSVVYIAFGSSASTSECEVQALAMGLQLSQKPFLWVLRAPSLMHLPHGFMAETKAQGLIVSWAPQFSVLCHPSVGGFISHCGWNSMMESFYAGVPIIGWPKYAEQRANLIFITEQWKVGIAIKTDGERDSECMRKENVERAIRRLMDEKEGEAARKNMEKVRISIKNAREAGGTSTNDLEMFLEEICARVK